MSALVNTNKDSDMKYIYDDAYQRLLAMGFESIASKEALETTKGNLENATSMLLDEATTKPSINSNTATPTKKASKVESKLKHNDIIASYKVYKCKEKVNHDKRYCTGYHSKSDRRRNPFDTVYSCAECPNSTEAVSCDEGDSCSKSHNRLERMFHPELFKISRCQRGPNGSACERGLYCAFAHSDDDHR